jgi:hypothetical protein
MQVQRVAVVHHALRVGRRMGERDCDSQVAALRKVLLFPDRRTCCLKL